MVGGRCRVSVKPLPVLGGRVIKPEARGEKSEVGNWRSEARRSIRALTLNLEL